MVPETSTNGRMDISLGESVVRPLKTAETVARDVVHDIVSQGLRTGDHLPSEAAMLEQYGVSRESLREGLRLLEVQGLITLRRGPGGGPVVGRLDPANLGRVSTLYYHLAGGTYAELFEAWVIAETILAERAARNPDRDAVRAALEPYLGDDEYGRPDGVAAYVQSATKFHSVVASLAENRVLELNLQTIGQIVAHHIAVNFDPRQLAERIVEEHEALARAIIAGHSLKARDLMEWHIRRQIDYFREHIGDQLNGFIEWH
jgi:GntR family transcriptional repressor for pyruvate dehydrogenase complex